MPEEATVEHAVGDGYQTIQLNGNARHVLGYLQDFLFTPERARTQIKFLSGGERNRVMLAKMFAKPANLLVLDEPTNDLDAETLELLEEKLVEFGGTLLLVSHDRDFLNNVVTSTIAFETVDGVMHVDEFVGGYDDWQRQSAQKRKQEAVSESKSPKTAVKAASGSGLGSSKTESSASPKPKLSFKEQRELEMLPEQIAELESAIGELHEAMADPNYYKQSGDVLAAKQSQLDKLEAQLVSSYERWELLESRK